MQPVGNTWKKKTNQQSIHELFEWGSLWIHLQTACKMWEMQCKMYSTQLEPSGLGTAEKQNKFNAFVLWSYTVIPDMECDDKKDQSQQLFIKWTTVL